MQQATNDKRFLPALTGLRGAAAVWVLFYHTSQRLMSIDIPFIRSGWIAVDIFFVLSGFILAHVHGNDFRVVSIASIKRFIGLRLARVYPVYIVMLIVVVTYAFGLYLIGVAVTAKQQFYPSLFLPNMLMIQSWGWVDHTSFNVVSWSISAEWMAYLVFPLLAFLGAQAKPIVEIIVALAFIGLAAIFYAIIHPSLAPHVSGLIVSSYAPIRVLTEFASGFFTYGVFKWPRADRMKAGVIGDIAVAAFVVMTYFDVFPLAVLLIPFIVFGLASGAGAAAWLLSRRTALYLGEISYSLYMVHFFIITVVFAPFHYTRYEVLLTNPYRVALLALAYLLIAIAAVKMHDHVEIPGRRWLQQRLVRRRKEALS